MFRCSEYHQLRWMYPILSSHLSPSPAPPRWTSCCQADRCLFIGGRGWKRRWEEPLRSLFWTISFWPFCFGRWHFPGWKGRVWVWRVSPGSSSVQNTHQGHFFLIIFSSKSFILNILYMYSSSISDNYQSMHLNSQLLRNACFSHRHVLQRTLQVCQFSPLQTNLFLNVGKQIDVIVT